MSMYHYLWCIQTAFNINLNVFKAMVRYTSGISPDAYSTSAPMRLNVPMHLNFRIKKHDALKILIVLKKYTDISFTCHKLNPSLLNKQVNMYWHWRLSPQVNTLVALFEFVTSQSHVYSLADNRLHNLRRM